jgi:glycosyltransferase involved in cell wall biosynthesis
MHEHGQIFQNNWYYELFIKIAKKRINLFIAVSKATRERLIKKASISKDKIKILYNFVDLDRFNKVNITWDVKKEKEKLGAEKDFVIGFVGRLSEVKGCEYLIRSLPYLRFNYKVVIVGDGPLREKLKNLSLKLELSENVIFIGYSEKMIKYFSLMNILVVPSLSESFGISAVEAQALEIPVTASNVPALNEIINNENGMLFEAKNPKDLSQKINKLYKNQKLRKELVKNGLKNAKKFDLNNYVAKLNQLYHEK